MSNEISHAELVVLGGGPGGYPAAFEAADHGMQVVLVDQDPRPGGVCLNRGCIPSKALLHIAKLIHEADEARDWGITFSSPEIDLDKVRGFKESVVHKLTGGIQQLCNARGVKLVQARGEFVDSSTLKLKNVDGTESHLMFDHCICRRRLAPRVSKVP